MRKGKMLLIILAGMALVGLSACTTAQPPAARGRDMTDDQAVWGN